MKSKKLIFTGWFISVILLLCLIPFTIDNENISLIDKADLKIDNIPHSSNQILWGNNGTVISNIQPAYQINPQICSDGAGGAIITWEDDRKGNHDIYSQRVDKNGKGLWGPNGTVICNDTKLQVYPQICNDGAGGAIIAWQDLRNSKWNLFAQRVDTTGKPLWQTNGAVICNATSNQEKILIISAEVGGAIIAWLDDRNYTTSGYDIYTQKVNAAGNRLWHANGTVICNATSDQDQLQICSDGEDGAIIVWRDLRNSNYDIYAQRVNATGKGQWGANGTAICNLKLSFHEKPQLINDGKGSAIITWEDQRNINWDIYAQKVNATGKGQWSSNGTAICNQIEDQVKPQIVSDGAGGAIIMWQYKESGIWVIYARKINNIGNPQWGINGFRICTTNVNQEYPKICSDGADGAIITWQFTYGLSNGDINAQRVDPLGNNLWDGVDGIVICNAANNQNNTQLIGDGKGGAIITWVDYRNSNPDIYSQRIAYPVILPPSSGDDDDDDDGKEKTVISFGNYYLVVAILGMVFLIIIYERKLGSPKKLILNS